MSAVGRNRAQASGFSSRVAAFPMNLVPVVKPSRGDHLTLVMVVVGKHFTFLLIVAWWFNSNHLSANFLDFLLPFQRQPSSVKVDGAMPFMLTLCRGSIRSSRKPS